MTIAELKEKIQAAKLFPITVEADVDEDEAEGITFNGSLEEYLAAVGSLGKTSIFIATQEIDEDDFQYNLRERSYDEDDESEFEVEEINVCLINPALERFKEKIGTTGIFRLFSSLSSENLNFYIEEEWWTEFATLYNEAAENILNNKIEIQKKMQAAQKEKNKELIKAVRELRHDKEFVNLRTQRAMSTYAKEKIPELDNLEPGILRQEIQILYDKIRQ
jgi:hypothetical protein